MPVVAAAAIAAGAEVFGASMQSSAAHRASLRAMQASNAQAKAQTEAANNAERFARQQAQNAYQNDEATRRANYEQWVARERRLGSIGASLGYGNREIPAYVPGVDPRFTDHSVQMPPAGATQPPMRDQYGRAPGDPEYGIPRPPQRPPSAPENPNSVGASLMGQPTRPTMPAFTPPVYSPATDPAADELRRQQLGGTRGSVGSYLLGRTA